MPIPANRRALENQFDELPPKIREYLKELPQLLSADFSLDVSLAYVFARVELAHNMTLYCGVVKLHHANSMIARSVIDAQHITREKFGKYMDTVLGSRVPETVREFLQKAEDTRDDVMHGRKRSERDKREAIANVIKYAKAYNAFVGVMSHFPWKRRWR